jgi:hypothetical protein
MTMPNTWKALLKGDNWIVQTQRGRIIATLGTGEEAKKNAKLIAASPYMLEALKAVVGLIGDEDLPDNGELSGAAVCDMVRAAISLSK